MRRWRGTAGCKTRHGAVSSTDAGRLRCVRISIRATRRVILISELFARSRAFD